MRPRNKKTTAYNVCRHEFYRAARSMRRALSDEQIFALVIDRKKEKLSSFTRSFGLMAALFIVLTNSDSNLYVSITTSFVELKIPKLYFVFAFSFIIMGVCMEFVSYMILNDYQSVVSSRFLKQGNSSIRGVIYDASSPWSFPLNLSYSFFEYKPQMKLVSSVSVIVLTTPILVVIGISYIYAISFSINYIRGYNFLQFGDVIAFVSFVVLLFPIAFIIFTFLPFGLSKNLTFIRWLFLSRIYHSDGRWPSAAYKWLKEEEKAPDSL